MRKFRIEIEQVNLPVGTESYKEQNGSILFRGKDGNIEAFLIPEVLSHPNIFKAITDNHDEEFQSVWKEFCTIHKCDVWNEIVYMDGAKKIFNHALTLSKERECVWRVDGNDVHTSCKVWRIKEALNKSAPKHCADCGGKIKVVFGGKIVEEKKEESHWVDESTGKTISLSSEEQQIPPLDYLEYLKNVLVKRGDFEEASKLREFQKSFLSPAREQAIGELISYLENHIRESPTLNKLIAAVKEGK